MDTVTHGIAGAVLSRAAARRPEARVALVFGAVAAMFPDLDFLFFPTRLQYLRDHRSWSHSFVYLPLFALGLALVARIFFRGSRFLLLWVFCALGIASHIVFDWITSFGTQFFYPLSRHRFSLDWVFILDPIFTSIPLVALVALLFWRGRARRIALAATAVLGLYILFCAVLHQRALSIWRGLDHPPEGAQAAALPQFLSPFRWLGLTERADRVDVCFFDIGPFARGVPHPLPPRQFSEIFSSLADFYPPPARASIQVFPQPVESPLLAACRRLPDVQVYLAFARFPLATELEQPGGGLAIAWEDLRFLPWFSGPWARDSHGGLRREPFVYRVRFDAAGRPVERSFVTSSGRPR